MPTLVRGVKGRAYREPAHAMAANRPRLTAKTRQDEGNTHGTRVHLRRDLGRCCFGDSPVAGLASGRSTGRERPPGGPTGRGAAKRGHGRWPHGSASAGRRHGFRTGPGCSRRDARHTRCVSPVGKRKSGANGRYLSGGPAGCSAGRWRIGRADRGGVCRYRCRGGPAGIADATGRTARRAGK